MIDRIKRRVIAVKTRVGDAEASVVAKCLDTRSRAALGNEMSLSHSFPKLFLCIGFPCKVHRKRAADQATSHFSKMCLAQLSCFPQPFAMGTLGSGSTCRMDAGPRAR